MISSIKEELEDTVGDLVWRLDVRILMRRNREVVHADAIAIDEELVGKAIGFVNQIAMSRQFRYNKEPEKLSAATDMMVRIPRISWQSRSSTPGKADR